MSTLTKQIAWTIFKGVAQGQKEAEKALARLTKGEFEAYDCWREDFEFEVAKVRIEAQNEAAGIRDDNPILMAELEPLHPSRWTAEDYTKLVSIFKGSKYEQLHLSAMFRVNNAELLLELAEPAS